MSVAPITLFNKFRKWSNESLRTIFLGRMHIGKVLLKGSAALSHQSFITVPPLARPSWVAFSFTAFLDSLSDYNIWAMRGLPQQLPLTANILPHWDTSQKMESARHNDSDRNISDCVRLRGFWQSENDFDVDELTNFTKIIKIELMHPHSVNSGKKILDCLLNCNSTSFKLRFIN